MANDGKRTPAARTDIRHTALGADQTGTQIGVGHHSSRVTSAQMIMVLLATT